MVTNTLALPLGTSPATLPAQFKSSNKPNTAPYRVTDRVELSDRREQAEKPEAADAGDVARAEHGERRNIALTKSEIHAQVQEQTVALIRSYLEDAPEANESLRDFFTRHPEAAKDIAKGEIPEYFNVENTGRRILDIYFSQFDGNDREAFAERARGIIEQAYGEVSELTGGLPDIVEQTKAYVLETLDKFAAGEDVSDRISSIEVEVSLDIEVTTTTLSHSSLQSHHPTLIDEDD